VKRTFVIGDIHGALKAIKQIIQQLQLQKSDMLIFAGDYVDGWSESFEVIEYLLDLQKKYSCIFIRGNHDVWCQQWLETGIADNTWLLHGGQTTVAGYAGKNIAAKQKHLLFFKQMHNYYIDEQSRLFIHAGFTSMHGPKSEVYETNFWWDRTLWETAVVMGSQHDNDSNFYPKRLSLFKEIYIGHTPTLHYDVTIPMQGCNVWNIDTGAGFYGKLSALNIDTKEFWQSDTCKSLYPNEKGRNNA
jgi:serine/threonine protein phosphatase 1